MKTLVSTLFVSLVLGSTLAIPVDDGVDDWSIENLLQAKKELFEHAEDILRHSLKVMAEEACSKEENIDLEIPLNEFFQRMKAIDLESDTYCALIKDNIDHVTEPLRVTIDKCGESSRLGPIATKALKTIKAVVQYACSLTGEQILELGNPCVDIINLRLTECGEELRRNMDTLSPENATGDFIEEVCQYLPQGRQCLISQLESKCDMEITKNTWKGLADAVMTACHKD